MPRSHPWSDARSGRFRGWAHLMPYPRIGQVFQAKARSISGFLALFLAGLFLSFGIVACSPGRQQVELTIVSFAVTKAAHNAIILKFAEQWKREHHQTVIFKQSYGGSGAQARAVIDGLEADIVHLALALDIKRLEKAKLIEPGWETEFPNRSIVSQSVAAIVVRPDNPQGIQTWSDLAKPGVSIITADPKTSGVARWNFLALWNAAIQSGATEEQARAFVAQVYRNVPILARDAREASDIFFKQEQGDVLINYENEVLLAAQKGKKMPFVVPEPNISIDNPIALVDANVDKHGNRAVAEAFVRFLFTPEAQAEFAKVGFRPVIESAQLAQFSGQFPVLKHLGNVQDYGGWTELQQKFFVDGAMFDQIQAALRK